MRLKIFLPVLVVIVLVALLAACAPAPTPAPTATDSPTPAPTATPLPTATPSPSPTATLTVTPSPSPTATLVPSPTPTVSPLLVSRPKINAGNAGQLQQFAQWGLGAITQQRSLRNGKLVLATTAEGLYLYEATSLKLLQFFAKARQPFVSEDESLLAYTDSSAIGLYDLANLKGLKSPPVAATLETGVFSPDGKFMAVVHSSVEIDIVRLSDLAVTPLTRDRTLSQEPVTNAVAFSPDNVFLLTGEQFRVPGAIARNVVMWNITEQKLAWYLKSTNLSLPEHPFSPDGRHFLTMDNTYTHVHESRFGGQLFSAVGAPAGAPFSPDGKLFFVVNKGVVTIYTAGDFPGGLVRVLVPEGAGGNYFSPDSTRFFAGDKVWTIGEWKAQPSGNAPPPQAAISPAQAVQLGHYPGLKALASGPGGEFWLWGSYDRTAYALETLSGRLYTAEFSASQQKAFNLDFNPATRRFAACTTAGLEVLNLRDGTRKLFNRCAANGYVAFSPDGTRLARASTIRVELLDPEDGSTLHHLQGHNLNISKISFSADGKWLALGTTNHAQTRYSQVSIWKLYPPTRVSDCSSQVIPWGVIDLVISPDGAWLAGTTDRLRLWRISDGEQVKFSEKSAASLAFSPDSLLVASTGYQGVQLWSIPALEPLGTLPLDGSALDLEFTPAGGLLTLGTDGVLRLWGVP